MGGSDQDILFSQEGRLGLACLNRPDALNALTEDMCMRMRAALLDWCDDPTVAAILVEGAGEKAFCAGGDVVRVANSGRAGDGAWRRFFTEEYRMNAAIARCPKPYIAFLDGVTMGGGVGISIHGDFRVATERTLFAMPETALGLIPDVGGSFFLSRLPDFIGLYLGLVGYRARAADCLMLGIATHVLPSDRLPEARARLASSEGPLDHDEVDAILTALAEDPGEAPLAAHREEIARHFGAGSPAGILESLARSDTGWAAATRQTLLAASPTSLALGFETIRRGAALGLEDCLRMEYRVVSHIVSEGHDFYEGVRAILIDKDRNPKWSPASIQALDPARIERHFADPGPDEPDLDLA